MMGRDLYTIVLASQKGGSGKTTLSGHLAVEADRAGAGPVVLIDTDPQGSLAQWWNSRGAQTPLFIKAGLPDLGAALDELRKAGVKLAIIDTPPAITSSISHVVGFADLVIVPARPSPHDLRAVGATVDIAERHDKPVIFVLNAATARARISSDSAIALSQHGTVAPVTIHHRVDFAASMVDGRTAGEIVPNSTSAREIAQLWTYVQLRLSKLMHDPQLLPEFTPKDQAVAPLLLTREEEIVALDDAPPAEDVVTPEPPPFYTGPERRAPEPPPYFGVERRANPRPAVFGRREGSVTPNQEVNGERK
jgi:chromosome partitioning protein